MRILHIISYFDIGGAERILVELLNELSKNNEVTLCILHPVKSDNYLFLQLDKKVITRIFNKKSKLYYLYFYNYFRNNRFDVVNGHLGPTLPSLILIKFLRRSQKVFYTVHFNLEKIPGKLNYRIHYIAFSILSIRVISISEKTENSVRKLFPRINSSVIYNGIKPLPVTDQLKNVLNEVNSLRTGNGTTILLAVGRLVPVKNYNLLINSVNSVNDSGKYNVVLLFIGDDKSEKKDELNRLHQLGGRGIYFMGEKTNIGDYLKCTDAICMSSVSEGLPAVLIEAGAAGVPAVCTNVGGIPEIISHGINGFLSANLNPEEYRSVLMEFLNLNDSERKRISENCKAVYLKNFTAQIMGEKYMKLYQE